MNIDLTTVPSFARWQRAFEGGHLGLEDYLNDQAHIGLAAAFAALFWPEFVEIRGCVIRRDRYDEENFEHWWSTTRGDRRAVEQVLNHLHLWDVFSGTRDGESDDVYIDVAKVMAKCWCYRLRDQFPGREFDVDVSGGEDEYGPTIYVTSRRE